MSQSCVMMNKKKGQLPIAKVQASELLLTKKNN